MAPDTKKFLELVKPHYNNALKYSRALCAGWNSSEAEDVLQDSFLKAMENLHALRDETKFRSWFFKIITREFYSSVRKHFWKKFLPMEDYLQVTEMPDVFSRYEQSEKALLLNNALSKLTKKERSAILLFEVAGFSIEEITEIQEEKSQSAVKSRLSRSRQKLKEIITRLESSTGSNFLVHNGQSEGDITNETISLVSNTEQSR
jgi:RNA polymerase sigma-70 factor (ECF subfamily)